MFDWFEAGDKLFFVFGEDISYQVVVVVYMGTNSAVVANELFASFTVYFQFFLVFLTAWKISFV